MWDSVPFFGTRSSQTHRNRRRCGLQPRHSTPHPTTVRRQTKKSKTPPPIIHVFMVSGNMKRKRANVSPPLPTIYSWKGDCTQGSIHSPSVPRSRRLTVLNPVLPVGLYRRRGTMKKPCLADLLPALGAPVFLTISVWCGRPQSPLHPLQSNKQLSL